MKKRIDTYRGHWDQALPSRVVSAVYNPAAWIIAVFFLYAFHVHSSAAGFHHPETDVKAAFIYNFTKFIQWPESSFRDDYLVIGYWGRGTMVDALRKLEGRKSLDKEVKIKEVSNPCDIQGVQVLVMAEEQFIDKKTLSSLEKGHVLTISEGKEALERGVIIALFKEGNKIRFAVNLKNAGRSGLKISSRLLKLAKFIVQ